MLKTDDIKLKLEQWGKAVIGSTAGYARISCLLGINTGSTDFTTHIPFSPEVEMTERAVCMLQGAERAVVVEHYTQPEATAEQHWWALRMSKSRYYRALDSAHLRMIENLNLLESATATKKTTIRNKNYKIQQEQQKTGEILGIK